MILLYGGSGHAKVIRDCITASGEKVHSIFDDNPSLKSLDDTPVVGAYNPDFEKNLSLIISIGDNLTRKMVSEKIKHHFGIAIHPSVIFSSYSKVLPGTVLMPAVVVNAGVLIKKHVIVNTGAIVEHDCVVEDYVHVSPSATLCGNVKVGEGTHIGAGAVVLPNLSIGKWCVIGAGAVVRENIPDYSVVIGVPGRIVGKTTKEV